MSTLTRNAQLMYLPAQFKVRGAGLLHPVQAVTFDPDPISRAQAFAHLALHHPDGRILECGKRGTRGGWIGMRCISDPQQAVRTKHATYHFIVEKLKQ